MLPMLFDPQKLLALSIEDYTSYMSKSIRNIILIFLCVLVAIPFILWFFLCHDILNVSLQIYQIIFSAGIVITLAMLFIQSCVTRKHKQDSIDSQKSNIAIELLYQWSKDSNAEMLLARKIVDRMNDAETKKLVDGNEPVSIAKLDYDMLKGFLPHDVNSLASSQNISINNEDDNIISVCEYASKCDVANSRELTMFETLWLRSWVVKYLNIMEIIMYAWKANIVEKSVIEKEFGYLVKSERDGSVVLENYRKLAGQENYPGIYSFCSEMEQRNKIEIETVKIQG